MSRTPPALSLCLLAATALAVGCATLAPPRTGPAPSAPAVAVLASAPDQWQDLVGQRVRISAPLTVSGNQRLVSDGVLVASFDGRLFTPTERALPGTPAAAVAAGNARRRLQLQIPSPTAGTTWPGGQPWRSGSVLAGVEGEVAVDAAGPVLRVDRPLQAQPAARPPAPEVPGDVRLASLNLENLFNGDGQGGGFPTARGARTHAAYLHQRARLVATVQALRADVVALMELENDGEGPDSSLAQLVDALNADGGDWRFVPACATPCPQPQAPAALAALGEQPIRVGLIYRAGRVVAVGPAATLAGGPFDARSRIPLAQAFRAGSGPVFTVVAVHFKSKGCRDAAGSELDQGDGQACWNPTRLESTTRLDAWLGTDPTRSGSDLVAILGDINAYAMEDPVRHLRASGWRDALAGVAAPYTYVFDAQAGRLDHALLSPTLALRLAGAAVWHSNADEAPGLHAPIDDPGHGPASPWRSSDHDPLLVGLRLRQP
ncbi:ExeM/NucH family extracellular endonuclease [soil metagenome]